MNVTDLDEDGRRRFKATLDAAIARYIEILEPAQQVEIALAPSSGRVVQCPDGTVYLAVDFEIDGRRLELMQLDPAPFGIHLIDNEVVVIDPGEQS